MTSSDRPTAASVITARGLVITNVLAQMTELASVGVASWLCSIDSIDPETWLMVIGAALFGPAVSKVRGVPPASSLVTALAMIPPSLLAAIKGSKLL